MFREEMSQMNKVTSPNFEIVFFFYCSWSSRVLTLNDRLVRLVGFGWIGANALVVRPVETSSLQRRRKSITAC